MSIFHKHQWKVISATHYEVVLKYQGYNMSYELTADGIKQMSSDKEWRTSVYKQCTTCDKTRQDILNGKHNIKIG